MYSTSCMAFAGGLALPSVMLPLTVLSLSLALSTPFTPVLQETLKSVIAQYNASQLLTMREVSTAAFAAKQAALLSEKAAMLKAACSCLAADCFVSQHHP